MRTVMTVGVIIQDSCFRRYRRRVGYKMEPANKNNLKGDIASKDNMVYHDFQVRWESEEPNWVGWRKVSGQAAKRLAVD